MLAWSFDQTIDKYYPPPADAGTTLLPLPDELEQVFRRVTEKRNRIANSTNANGVEGSLGDPRSDSHVSPGGNTEWQEKASTK